MKHEELQQALRLIAKVLAEPRLELGQRNQLLRAKRELETFARSGKADEKRLFRAIECVANVLLELVESEAIRRPE